MAAAVRVQASRGSAYTAAASAPTVSPTVLAYKRAASSSADLSVEDSAVGGGGDEHTVPSAVPAVLKYKVLVSSRSPHKPGLLNTTLTAPHHNSCRVTGGLDMHVNRRTCRAEARTHRLNDEVALSSTTSSVGRVPRSSLFSKYLPTPCHNSGVSTVCGAYQPTASKASVISQHAQLVQQRQQAQLRGDGACEVIVRHIPESATSHHPCWLSSLSIVSASVLQARGGISRSTHKPVSFVNSASSEGMVPVKSPLNRRLTAATPRRGSAPRWYPSADCRAVREGVCVRTFRSGSSIGLARWGWCQRGCCTPFA